MRTSSGEGWGPLSISNEMYFQRNNIVGKQMSLKGASG